LTRGKGYLKLFFTSFLNALAFELGGQEFSHEVGEDEFWVYHARFASSYLAVLLKPHRNGSVEEKCQYI